MCPLVDMKIVSACLAGIDCRWNGRNKLNRRIKELVDRREAIVACPEVLGGLPVPRRPAGIYGGLGGDVWNGKASVKEARRGKDVTKYFKRGALKFLEMAESKNIKEAVLKQKSPSCGCGKTWQLDDDFTNRLVNGNGVTAALLKRHDIKIFTEENFRGR